MTAHVPFLELAAAAIDFELTQAERTRLERHLASCPACRAGAGALHADARSLASLPPVRLPARRADELLATALHPGVVRHPLRLLAVAALLGLLLVGSIAIGTELLRRAQDDLSVVLPVPSVSLDPDASPVAPTWASAVVPAAEAGGRWEILVHGVAVGSNGMVAYGRAQCRDDETDCRLAMLWSADGAAWSMVPPQASLATEPYWPTNGPELGIIDVASGAAGWVAIGRVADPVGPGEPVDFHVAVWTSGDGQTWTRADRDPLFADADPKAIAAGNDGYVIVGTDFRESADLAQGRAYAASWTSLDGREWTRAPDEPVLDVGGFGDTGEWPAYGGMQAVAPLPGVGFVAVGTTLASAPDGQPSKTAAWTSLDGLSWQRISGFPAITAWGVDVTADDRQVAALVGCEQAGCSTIATSPDGAGWAAVPGPDDAAPSTIAIVDGDVVIGGPNGIGRLGSKLWRLDEAGRWSTDELPPSPVATIRVVSIAVKDETVSVVGWGENFPDGEAPSYAFVRR